MLISAYKMRISPSLSLSLRRTFLTSHYPEHIEVFPAQFSEFKNEFISATELVLKVHKITTPSDLYRWSKINMDGVHFNRHDIQYAQPDENLPSEIFRWIGSDIQCYGIALRYHNHFFNLSKY